MKYCSLFTNYLKLNYSNKVASVLSHSPSAELKRKLLTLNEVIFGEKKIKFQINFIDLAPFAHCCQRTPREVREGEKDFGRTG